MAQSKRTRRRSSGKGGQPSALHSLLWYVLGLVLGLAVLLPLLFWDSQDSEDGGEPRSPQNRDRPQQGTAPDTKPVPDPAADRAERSASRQAKPAPEQPANGSGDSGAAPARPEDDADGGYRFYTLLPEMEVEVPDPAHEAEPDEPAETGPADPPQAPPEQSSPQEPLPQTEAAGRFLVQVAAFRQRTAAEDLKARLAMRGLQAQVVTAELGDRGTWHRVRLGPYPGRDDAERVRERLADDGMQAMILNK
jgi:cell division protein FtsN